MLATLDGPVALESDAEDGGAASDPAAFARALRRQRQRVVLRTLLRDLTGRADLAEVCATMTRLAEAAIAAAVDLQHRQLAQLHGEPIGADERPAAAARSSSAWASSAAASSTCPPTSISCSSIPRTERRRAPKALANQEFFDRLGRRVIAALADVTADGFVFRVDMRLRPYGDSGPLSSSFAALEQYLVTQGRTWERYAWLKARALTGDAATELERLIVPFVFRKYLDYDAYAGLRDVHGQIREQGRRKDYARNIKLGPGGIREIEFIVQALQLVRGGKEPALRVRGTLPALAAVGARGLLPRTAVTRAVRRVRLSAQSRASPAVSRRPADARPAGRPRGAGAARARLRACRCGHVRGGARRSTAAPSSGTSRRCSARSRSAQGDPLAARLARSGARGCAVHGTCGRRLRRTGCAARHARPRAPAVALPAAADTIATTLRRAGAADAARRGDGGRRDQRAARARF